MIRFGEGLPTLSSNHEKTQFWLGGATKGIEIGAHVNPLPNIKPVYVDIFEEFAGQKCLVDVLADSRDLPFEDSSLEYVANSHVLEHIADPIGALVEWVRVLKGGGIIYMVVPDKRFTWERERPAVPVEHLLDDFKRHTSQSDRTHIDEFIGSLVWEEFKPGGTEDEREDYRRRLHEAVDQGLDINIHFHAFLPDTGREIIKAVNGVTASGKTLELVDLEERFPSDCPNGLLMVLKVTG